MPNWTSNTLYIEGNEKQVQEFITKLNLDNGQSDNFSILQKLYPCPQDLLDTPATTFVRHEGQDKSQEELDLEKQQQSNLAKYEYKDWYDWKCANWGTKWSESELYMHNLDNNSVSFVFNTAWSPPIAGFDKISKDFPELTFIMSYYEQGCGFAGCAGFLNGLVVEEYSENISVPEPVDDEQDEWELLDDAYMDLCSELETMVRDQLDELTPTPLTKTND